MKPDHDEQRRDAANNPRGVEQVIDNNDVVPEPRDEVHKINQGDKLEPLVDDGTMRERKTAPREDR